MTIRYKCPQCGDENHLYARSDVRWDATAQEWLVVMDALESEIDCTECDWTGEIADTEFEPPADD